MTNKHSLSETERAILLMCKECRFRYLDTVLAQQFENPAIYGPISFTERLKEALLSAQDLIAAAKTNNLLKQSGLRGSLDFEDLAISKERGFTRETAQTIVGLSWLHTGKVTNLGFFGASGTGKTSALTAIGRMLCKNGISVRYYKGNDLIEDLAAADKPGRDRLRTKLKRTNVLILDDLGMLPANEYGTTWFFEILDDRNRTSPVIFASQFNEEGIRKAFQGKAQTDGIMRRLFEVCIQVHLRTVTATTAPLAEGDVAK